MLRESTFEYKVETKQGMKKKYIYICICRYIGNVLSAPFFPPEQDEKERRRDVNATKQEQISEYVRAAIK